LEYNHNITLVGKVDALYTITYVYETSDGLEKSHVESYKSGDEINYSWLDSDTTKNEIGSKEGYTFEWTWPGAVDRCPSAMPAQDIWVTGKFVPNTYEITVKYVDESGNNLVDSSDPISAHYGDERTIQAKEIANYTPDAASKTVTVTGNCEVVFTYTKITGTLVINYCDTYGNTLYSYSQGDEGAINKIAVLSSVQSISAGTNYDINAATVAGFTPTKIKIGDNSVVDYIEDGISFTPTEAQCQSGVNVYIYYAPNTYTLKFDAGSDATVTPSFRKVQYANTYSFDPWAVTSNGASPYSDLPTPKRDGYTFTGWYTTDPATNQTEATKITADSIFLNTEDQTLYAGWQEDNIISYTISWDSLDFDMTDLVWDTESHVYVGSTFVQSASGDTSQSGSPAISVKNTGTVELNVNYSYVPSDEHKTITGQFSSTKANDDDANNDTIPRDVASSVLFSLSGTGRVTQLLNSCFTAGQCVVKVSSNLTGQTNAEGGES
jgi:uncharacterized repeat protein (TIGR02543 family)